MKAKREMIEAQRRMHDNPGNLQLAQEELIAVREYRVKIKHTLLFYLRKQRVPGLRKEMKIIPCFIKASKKGS